MISFKGVPFAAPPVGPLRWRAPQPAAHWLDVRDATAYGHDCMQKFLPSEAALIRTEPAEDCLYANVWRPARTTGKMPVLIWIYGGGFLNGGTSPSTYSGATLAKNGIVFVSFNYQLGRFGFFAHPQLSRAHGDGEMLADYGYMDQLAALRWIKRNIAAFGGDPSNMTLVGESAGGISIHALMVSPSTKGLFQRVAILSGGPGGLPTQTLSQAETTGIAFAKTKGIMPDDPQALAKLRALSSDAIVDGLDLLALFAPKPGEKTFSSPIDQNDFPSDVTGAYAKGRFDKVPVMVGATNDDLGGPQGVMAAGADQVARLLSAQHLPVYRYRFSYVAQSARTPATKGAEHATDVPFFLDTQAIKYGSNTTAGDDAVGKLVSSYLINFVKTGKPDGPGLTRWPTFSDRSPDVLDFTAAGRAQLGR